MAIPPSFVGRFSARDLPVHPLRHRLPQAVVSRVRVGLVCGDPLADALIVAALEREGLTPLRVAPETGRLASLRALWHSDVVLKSFGAYSAGYFRLFVTAKMVGKRIALFWIGTDVLHAGSSHRRWAARIQRLVDLNLTVTPELRDELLTLGIPAHVVPIVSDLSSIEVQPLPEGQTVLSYLPPAEHRFYGSELVRDLARKLPDTQFVVVGGWHDPAPPANVKCLGFVRDMAAVYRRCSVLVRLTPHDGLPKMLLEALAYGRNVVWSRPFPHCHVAHHPAEALELLLALRNQTHPNLEGARYVRDHYSFFDFAAMLADHMRKLGARA